MGLTAETERSWLAQWRAAALALERQAGRLDEQLIFRELEPLLELKGAPETGPRLRSTIERARS